MRDLFVKVWLTAILVVGLVLLGVIMVGIATIGHPVNDLLVTWAICIGGGFVAMCVTTASYSIISLIWRG